MKKFNEFKDLRESAIILAGVDEKNCELTDYKDKIKESEAIKKEMANFYMSEMEEVDDNFDTVEENVDFDESELSEGALNEKVNLKTSTNPLARLFRWSATLRAKAQIAAVYKQSLSALAAITGNQVKLEIKKDEIGKISGPEAKVKMKELDNMIEAIMQRKEMANQKKQQAIDKIMNPGFFGAGGMFGLNKDVLDKQVALLNTQEKLQLAELKMKQAQKLLTDKEMTDLKDSVKQLKAREAKYAEESKNIEQAVINAVEKNDFTEADQEVKAEAERLKNRIVDIDKKLSDLRTKIASEEDSDKKKDFSKEYESMMKDRQKAEKEIGGLAKKAAKAVLGSSKAES